MGDVILLGLVAWMTWDILFGDPGLTRSRKEVMARMRKKNERRGIVMRPGWRYPTSDGGFEVSATGRLRDLRRYSPRSQR